MNKLLVIFLAVCLVSVHAFVRRDAPAEAPKTNDLEGFTKQVQEFGKSVGDQLKNAFDSKKLQEGFKEFMDNLNKAVEGTKTPAAE